jgi:dipeptidyl aminopeptidase/acylaminoacyl peptidase
MKTERVSFRSQGQRISGILHLPPMAGGPCVIACHGLLASKDSDKYVALGDRMAREGIALLRFDFRGCGESEGRIEESTVSGRIEDLGAALDFVRSYPGLDHRVGLLGSSLGGYVSLIKASRDPEVRAIVTWATPFHLDDLESKKGEEGIPSLGEGFFSDLRRHRLLPLLPKVSNCLVIHGEQDELVPVGQAREIFRSLGTPKEIHIIEGADHRLTNESHRQRAIDLSVAWFRKYLR